MFFATFHCDDARTIGVGAGTTIPDAKAAAKRDAQKTLGTEEIDGFCAILNNEFLPQGMITTQQIIQEIKHELSIGA